MKNYINLYEARTLSGRIPGIYAIVNYPSVYIGATNDLKRRFTEHISQFKTKPKKQQRLSRMFSEKGIENSEVRLLFTDPAKSTSTKTLHIMEAAAIKVFQDERYDVLSSSAMLETGSKNKFYGKTHSQEYKNSIQKKIIAEHPDYSIEFDSVTIAAKALGIGAAAVVNRCRRNTIVNNIKLKYRNQPLQKPFK